MPSQDYIPLVSFLIAGFVVALIPLLANLILSKRTNNPNKLKPYECGFDSFSDARQPFDMRFYRIALLFLLLELEMVFLFPWALPVRDGLDADSYGVMMLFLGLLVVGLIYEWRQGALEWD